MKHKYKTTNERLVFVMYIVLHQFSLSRRILCIVIYFRLVPLTLTTHSFKYFGFLRYGFVIYYCWRKASRKAASLDGVACVTIFKIKHFGEQVTEGYILNSS